MLKSTQIYARFASEVYDDFGDSRAEQEYYRKEHADREIRKQKREKYLVMADKCYANAMLMYLKRDTDPVK